MKNSHSSSFCLFTLLCLCLSLNLAAQTTLTYYNQSFVIDTLYPASGSAGMNSPWEVLYGPDDSLWVTESHAYKIWKIHPGNKGSRMVLDMNTAFYKDFNSTTANPWPQGGLMGLAVHPQFRTGKPWVYIAYVYHLVGCATGSNGKYCSYKTKVARYRYSFSDGSLTWMDDVIQDLDGSNDHNSGRIKISPLPEADGNYHLYYTIGDMGAGNLTNIDRPNHAQDTTILEGKVLRLNTEPDPGQPSGPQQWIPGDNPFPAGAAPSAKSPVYSFGHRNPQGLDFGSVDGGASYILYSSEHGDQSDDEVNIILPHINYGWPKVAGLCDDNYTSGSGDSMYLAGKSVISEHGFCDTTPTTLQEPIFAFYNWGRNANKISGALGNMNWPTVAPSAIRFYGHSAIPGWNYSLLIPSLKNGLFRLKLKADGLSIDSTANPTDTLHYLAGYRLRNITVAPTGDTLFVAVDNSCCTLGTSGTIGNSVASPNLGFILRMVYVTPLSLPGHGKGGGPGSGPGAGAGPGSAATDQGADVNRGAAPARAYPNPAHGSIRIEGRTGDRKPWLANLYTVAGQLVAARGSYENNFTLDLGGVQPGVYILRLFNGIGAPVLIQKVLVE
ncbi:MAG TPA: PQQ-dependent sugar dehydrogenase [Puia sp.]|nr:PQQ-dependent sugar dehydrogenase [Puia sp.]